MFNIGKFQNIGAAAVALLLSTVCITAAVAPARAVETGSVYAALEIGEARV